MADFCILFYDEGEGQSLRLGAPMPPPPLGAATICCPERVTDPFPALLRKCKMKLIWSGKL